MCVPLAIFLLLLSSPQRKHDNKQTVRPDHANTPSQQTNQVPPPTVVHPQIVLCEHPGQDKQGQRNDEHDRKMDVVDRINSVSTAVVALFTFLTFLVFRGQLRATKISERAWMVSKSISELPTYSAIGHQPDTFQIRFLLANMGRTPAWITGMGSRANLLPKGKTLPLEPEYDWAGPFPSEGTVLPPDANIPQGVDITLVNLSQLDSGVITLYFYGVVQYRDIFRKKHETKYCYVFKLGPNPSDPSPRDFYIGGPAGYNRAT